VKAAWTDHLAAAKWCDEASQANPERPKGAESSAARDEKVAAARMAAMRDREEIFVIYP
jgi:hypothetical protein